MRFSPGLARSRETAVILGHSRHSRAVSTVLDGSRSFSVSSRGLVCITGREYCRAVIDLAEGPEIVVDT
jgi:hypothetical protein